MDKKQMRLTMILPVMGLAALCATRRAHANEASVAVQAILAAKSTWVLAYATPGGRDLDSKRYELARLLCYAPDNETEILDIAFKLQNTTDLPFSSAVGVATVSVCNKAFYGRAE